MADNYQTKNKWSSQQIQKQFKNNHHDGLYAGWRKYSNSNHSNSFLTFCNEYQKNMYYDYIEIMDEYEFNLYEPQYWRCNNCTFDNVERDLYCHICKLPFKSSNAKMNTSQNTLSDYLPSEINNIIHSDDDLDESIQVAIILSLEENNHNNYDEITFDFSYKSETKTISKPTLTGYKSNKTKNKKYCPLTDSQDNTIEIKTKKEWCIHKKSAAKQKQKHRQRNKRDNKTLRKNHAKCIKTLPKLKGLINKTKINCVKKQIKESYSSDKKFDIKCILNYKIFRKFSKNRKDKLKIVYHGTRSRNNQSIIENGLIVGGTKGIGVRIGSLYGRGVYCSPYISTARGYEDGSMFICAVNNTRVNHFGSIWVVPDEKDILPLFLASFDKENIKTQTNIRQVNRSNKSNDGLSQQIIKFIPSFNLLNTKAKNRKIKRKWNAYFKIKPFYH